MQTASFVSSFGKKTGCDRIMSSITEGLSSTTVTCSG